MLAFSPDGRWLAAAGADAQVSVWDVASGRLQAVIEHRARVRNVAFSADGSLLLTRSRTQALLWQWQQSVTRPLTMLDLSDRFETVITGAALHPTQPLLAIVTRDGLVMVWNYRTAQTLVKTVDERANGQVRFNPQGTVVVSESNEGIILLRDSATLNQRDFPASHRGGIADFAFDPSGTLIATAGFDQTVKIWQFADGIEQMRMGVDGLPVAIGFSGPRELVAVSANGSVIRLPLNLDTALDLAVMRSRRPTADECVRYQLAREDASLCQ